MRDTVKEQDKETIDRWKDELNNLLVFVSILDICASVTSAEISDRPVCSPL